MSDKPLRDYRGRFGVLKCINAHDRCFYGADENCPYCEVVAPDRLKKKS